MSKNSLKIGDRVIVKIEKLISGGPGLARYEGKVVFVDFAAPGDLLEIKIYESKSSFSRGKIHKIIEESSLRETPLCEVFGQCGGCQWQHLQYQAQVDAKQNILTEVIQKFFSEEKEKLGAFHKSPNLYYYRNRIQVRSEKGRLGFYGRKSHELVPIKTCPIAEKSINKALISLIESKPSDGRYRLQMGLKNEVEVTKIDNQEEPLGFSQVNSEQNEKLQKEVYEAYEQLKGAPIVDLFGGYGNLSIPIARKFPNIKIECVEWNQQAVLEGISRVKKENLLNFHFINNDVESYINRVNLPPDACVILDPPREGCKPEVIRKLVANNPKRLIYVSCDPMTWGRDCDLFFKEANSKGTQYRIATIHGLDMFPQTDHIEVFSVIDKIEN